MVEDMAYIQTTQLLNTVFYELEGKLVLRYQKLTLQELPVKWNLHLLQIILLVKKGKANASSCKAVNKMIKTSIRSMYLLLLLSFIYIFLNFIPSSKMTNITTVEFKAAMLITSKPKSSCQNLLVLFPVLLHCYVFTGELNFRHSFYKISHSFDYIKLPQNSSVQTSPKN